MRPTNDYKYDTLYIPCRSDFWKDRDRGKRHTYKTIISCPNTKGVVIRHESNFTVRRTRSFILYVTSRGLGDQRSLIIRRPWTVLPLSNYFPTKCLQTPPLPLCGLWSFLISETVRIELSRAFLYHIDLGTSTPMSPCVGDGLGTIVCLHGAG